MRLFGTDAEIRAIERESSILPGNIMDGSTSAQLPIIDFFKIRIPHDSSDAKAIEQNKVEKQRFFQALQEVGFVYLKNHDIGQSNVQTVFSHAKRFFSLDESEKAKIETGESKSFRGWFSPARTSANARFSDQKEAFDMGDDNDPTRPNQWPGNMPGFRDDMNEMFEKCHKIHLILLGALAEAVGLPTDHFVQYVDKKHHFFRVIYYPETPVETFKERVRAATHTDYGTLTLLFNDESGGLQVRGRDGKFFNAPPVPGCAIINGEFFFPKRKSISLMKSYAKSCISGRLTL